MTALIALAMSASICVVAVGGLIGIAVFWIQDQRGRHRPGRRRVRRQRTNIRSRGHRPYRGGRVRV